MIAGTDLTGGGASGVVTLNLDTTKVPQLNTANAFTGNQTVNGTLTATGNVSGALGNFTGGLTVGSPLAVGGAARAILSADGTSIIAARGNGVHNDFAVGFGAYPAAALPNGFFGFGNTAVGNFALSSSVSGKVNTAVGAFALSSSITDSNNTAVGSSAMLNVLGSMNTAVGSAALTSGGDRNTPLGAGALEIASSNTNHDNIAIGAFAGSGLVNGSNNIYIGANPSTNNPNESGVIRLGKPGTQTSTLIAGIRGVTTANNDAIPVVIDSNGQLGTGPLSAGGGTITAVNAGIGLTGGGTSGAVTLNVDATKVPQLNTANAFVGNQSITGNLTATGSGKFAGGIMFGDGSTQVTATLAGPQGPQGAIGPAGPGGVTVSDANNNVLGSLAGFPAINFNSTGLPNSVWVFRNGYFVNVSFSGNFQVGGFGSVIYWTGANCTGSGILQGSGITSTRFVTYSNQNNSFYVVSGSGIAPTSPVAIASQESFSSPSLPGVSNCTNVPGGQAIGFSLSSINASTTFGWNLAGNPLSVAGPIKFQ